MSLNPEDIDKNGWTAVPLDAAAIFDGKPFLHEPKPVPLDDIAFPSEDPVVAQVLKYVKERLPEPTLNHSMRAYYWGMVILKQQFPAQAALLSPATYALACLLHDIGTSDENVASTRMSFEYQGAFISLALLRDSLAAPRDQADAVAEAIVRHTQVGPARRGTVTLLGQLLQLATVYDNIGAYQGVADFAALVDQVTIREVTAKYPRHKWLACFGQAMVREVERKPWCHMLDLPGFLERIEGNELMKPYE